MYGNPSRLTRAAAVRLRWPWCGAEINPALRQFFGQSLQSDARPHRTPKVRHRTDSSRGEFARNGIGVSGDFRTKCFRGAMRPRVAFIVQSQDSFRVLKSKTRRLHVSCCMTSLAIEELPTAIKEDIEEFL